MDVHTAQELTNAHFPLGALTLAVFGPGSGEAQLLRFPDGTFGVLDGCVCGRSSSDPVAAVLDGVDQARLRFVGLTHAHEDHFGGLSALIQSRKPDMVLWAGTEHPRLRDRFVKVLRERPQDPTVPPEAAPKELQALIDTLARGGLGPKRRRPQFRAVTLADHKLIQRLDGTPPVDIWGVLPTTTALHQALRGRRHAAPRVADAEARPRPGETDPNDVSGAMLIEWGATRALLGGDALLGHEHHHEGLRAARWIPSDIQVVKVPHHGSSGAHSRALWARMRPQVAIVTPYKQAKGAMPPTADMLGTLIDTGARVFVTARPEWWGRAPHGLVGFDAPPERPPQAHRPRPAPPMSPAAGVAVTLDETGRVRTVTLAGRAAEVRRAG